MISRRALLAGVGAAWAGAAVADAPTVSLRPMARGQLAVGGAEAVSLPELIAEARVTGNVGFVVADLATGQVLEEVEGGIPRPPASVAKTITSLYALELPGAAHRFVTSLVATGSVTDGVLDGDLILAGGGDPTLSTDNLAAMAEDLKAAGVRSITGGFQVWGGALPHVKKIDQSQQEHLGYNPALCGLNLNYNRVYFEWAQSGSDYRVTMDARTDLFRPDVHVARMRVVDRAVPVYTYDDAGGVDDWTVAKGALGEGGSRWLPVRYPALYAGDVFRTLAVAQGITLPEATEVTDLPIGTPLVVHESDTLEIMIRDMLLYSTNLTAEAIGLTATKLRGLDAATLADSARAMSDWAVGALGVGLHFVDHSGLGDASRVSPEEMVKALIAAGETGQLRPLLKDIPLLDANGDVLRQPPASVVAKTGTLNFVAGLAGYVRTERGADLAFAIFAADPEARAVAQASEDEIPDGARPWNGRVRHLQQRLLQRWGLAYPA